MSKPQPYNDIRIPLLSHEGVVHRYGFWSSDKSRSITACGVAMPASFIEPRFLNPETTRPCRRCWNVEFRGDDEM